MADDDDFDLDGALEQSLAQMEANESKTNDDNNNNNKNVNNQNNSNKKSNDNNNNIDDDAIMQDALNAVQQSINNANDAQTTNDMMNDDEMKDFFNEIFKSFSNLDDDADDESLDKALKKVMTQFFDANQLKEPVKIICSKYPSWLAENKQKITNKEYTNYKAQYELYAQANELLNTDKPDTNKIMDILLKTFSYGSLPAQVMDGMMPDELKQFADQMAKFEKEVDNETVNKDDKNNNNNNNINNNNNNNNEEKTNENNDDMNPEEAMKFFSQLMGMQNGNKNNDNKEQKNDGNDGNDGNDNDFMPNLKDLPKLSESEMQQFKQLMNQDGCSIM